MPLPVIADGFQVDLTWTSTQAPRPAHNVIHFVDQLGTQTEADLFTDFDANVTAAMWSYGSTNSKVTGVQITKLDGASAGVGFTPGAVAKWAGGNSGHIIPQGAIVVSLKSAQRGPRGRNRLYLPWVAEATVDDGVLAAGNVSGMTTAWTAFLAAMDVQNWEPVAVSGVHSDSHPVTSVVIRSAMKTQRRRSR